MHARTARKHGKHDVFTVPPREDATRDVAPRDDAAGVVAAAAAAVAAAVDRDPLAGARAHGVVTLSQQQSFSLSL